MGGVRPMLVALAAGGICLATFATPSSAQQGPDPSASIDSLFSRYGPETPGVAVRVISDGRIVHAGEYGMAHLEHPAPITASTRFLIGSNSKQFTAFAISVLARDGRLDLDADVRSYVPEVPDFGTPITIRQLLHHQSGIRDWVRPFAFAGFSSTDVITFDQVIQFLRRQRGLNFPPGTDYMYSNTGYVLLAEVVQRVTDTPFPEWMRTNVFEPLGMESALVRDSYRQLVPGLASSYDSDGDGGYEVRPHNLTAFGSCCVVMTIDDLARWAGNLITGEVGGREAIAPMQEDLVEIAAWDRLVGYGYGLMRFDYHGHAGLFHSGQWVGFRSAVLVLPEERFAVVALGNAGSTVNLREWDILDLYLGNLDPEGAPAVGGGNDGADGDAEKAAPYEPLPGALEEYVGRYFSSELDAVLRFETADDRLVARQLRWGADTIGFSPVRPDEFEGDALISTARFLREGGLIVGVEISGRGALNLRFERVRDAGGR